MRLVILASGNGSLAQAIIDANFEIVGIITDVENAPVVERAKNSHINVVVVPYRTPRSAWDSDLEAKVADLNPDLVVSVGFMRILSSSFVKRFKVINSHPSLLPDFPGAHAVRDALLAGATETGCTVHWVDEGIDTGPVITQHKVSISPDDDESSLHERIKVVERDLIVDTIRKIGAGV